MNIFDNFRKKPTTKKAAPFGGKDNRTLEMKVLEARTKLELAREKNQNVINMELRNIRYNRKNNLSAANEARYMMKIKNAYYSISLINNAKEQLNDIQTSQELFAAMNHLTDALHTINVIYRLSDKPKPGKMKKEKERLDGRLQDEDDRMGDLYRPAESIDDIVSNDVVERLLQGDRVEDCLRSEEGIMLSSDELANIDLDKLFGKEPEVREMESPVDDSELDFSDLKL